MFSNTTTKIAIVAIDVIGYYSKANYYGLGEIKKSSIEARVTEILVAALTITKLLNHRPWGPNTLSDGKYPKYLRFIDRQIAKAINKALPQPCAR